MSKLKKPRSGEHELVPIHSGGSPDDDSFDLDLESRPPRQPQSTRSLAQIQSDSLDPDEEEQDPDMMEMQMDGGEDAERYHCCWWKRRKLFCGLLLLASLILAIVLGVNNVPIPGLTDNSTTIKSIQKSPSDTRDYRYIQLAANSLPVLLIHDADTEKASVAMSVGVGSASDFPHRAGLAHFLEHCLFLGSHDFPNENDYFGYLQAHGGSSNAYTSEEETNYFFDVQATIGNLNAVLPRFAGFFIEPTLNESSITREMKAVENEHSKNLLNDNWRLFGLLHEISDPSSSYHHFGTGTVATLSNTTTPTPLEDLKRFRDEYYHTEYMRLVILGRESLDELEILAKTHFGRIKGSQLKPECSTTTGQSEPPTNDDPGASLGGQSFRGSTSRLLASTTASKSREFGIEATIECTPKLVEPFTDMDFNHSIPFTPSTLGRNITWIPATTPSHQMNLYFPLPSNKYPVDTQIIADPFSYLGYMFGHEGSPHTLVNTLKRLNLIESLSAGLVFDSKEMDQSLFGLEMKLTTLGNQYKNRMTILTTIFEYIQLLIKTAPLRDEKNDQTKTKNSHQDFYENMLAESTVRWKYAEKERPIDYTSTLASRMNNLMPFGLDISQILLPPTMHQYDGTSISTLLSYFQIEKSILFWSSSDLQNPTIQESVAPTANWTVEPWYTIPYLNQPYTSDFLTAFNAELKVLDVATATTAGMTLPPKLNQFIPNAFDILPFQTNTATVKSSMKSNTSLSSSEASSQFSALWSTYDALNDVPISLLDSTTTNNTLFYKPDTHFGLPYTFVSTFIRVQPGYFRGDLDDPDKMKSAGEHLVQFQLLHACLQDIFNAITYQLGLVGYSFTIEYHPSGLGFTLNLSGFSSNLLDVWSAVLTQFTQVMTDKTLITDDRLAILNQQVYDNIYSSFNTANQPYQHGLYFIRLWEEHSKASLPELQAIYDAKLRATPYTVTNLQTFMVDMLSTIGTTTYVYGNVNSTTAKQFYDNFQAALTTTERPAAKLQLPPASVADINVENANALFILPVNSSFVFESPVLNPAEVNSALIYDLQICTSQASDASLIAKLKLRLISQILQSKAFSTLRTSESLGYIVTSRIRESVIGMGEHSMHNFEVLIQSENHDPIYLESRVEVFLLAMEVELKSLLDADFQLHLSTLNQTLALEQSALSSMSANFDMIWSRKISRDMDTKDFNTEARQIDLLKSITKDQVVEFYVKKFVTLSTRRKLVMEIYGKDVEGPMDRELDESKYAPEALPALEHDYPIAYVVQGATPPADPALLSQRQKRAKATADQGWGWSTTAPANGL